MNLTIKTLKGSKFTITVDPTDKVSAVKCTISTSQPDLPSESMKLIHSGKVLKDEDEIGSCGIGEADFLVVMVAKVCLSWCSLSSVAFRFTVCLY